MPIVKVSLPTSAPEEEKDKNLLTLSYIFYLFDNYQIIVINA